MLPISFPIVSFLSWPQLVSFVLMICFPIPMWRLWAPCVSQNGNLCDSRILCQDPSSTPAPERRGQMHLRVFLGAPILPHSPLMTQLRNCHLKVVLGVASFVSFNIIANINPASFKWSLLILLAPRLQHHLNFVLYNPTLITTVSPFSQTSNPNKYRGAFVPRPLS